MIKKLFVIPFLLVVYNPFKANVHEILVWDGYMQFMPSNLTAVQLGDTIEWLPLDIPTMTHTITSTNTPIGATPFDQIWQAPLDTFFRYIPSKIGLYEYVCTPHISNGMIGSFNVEDTTLSITNNLLNIIPVIFPNPTNDYIQFSSEFNNLKFSGSGSTAIAVSTKPLFTAGIQILPILAPMSITEEFGTTSYWEE